MRLEILFSLLIFFGLLSRTLTQDDEPTTIEHYYTVNSDKDADFYLSQVYPLLTNPTANVFYLGYPHGGMSVIQDEDGKDYCYGKGDVCRVSLIHFCIEIATPNQVSFLRCYFQSEFFPLDMYTASRECWERENNDAVNWDTLLICADNSFDDFAEQVVYSSTLPPLTEETPKVVLDFVHPSALAAVDLEKALCRETAADIGQCESVHQYRQPMVQIFYSVYDDTAAEFFVSQFNETLAERIIQTVYELDVIPNPNYVLNCGDDDETCWNYQAHWCLYENFANLLQLEIIQCTFEQVDAINGSERIRPCLEESQFQDVLNCIDVIDSMSGSIKVLQDRLNLRLEQSAQQPVEVIIQDQLNDKAVVNGLLQELCYNYFQVDEETLGCRVVRPTVQIFYETASPEVEQTFLSLANAGRYAPFETVADFEFIPYGKTQYIDEEYVCAVENQCTANFIHGCIIQMHYSTLQEKFLFMKFFTCATAYYEDYSSDPLNQTEACVKQVYDYGDTFWPSLLECAQSNGALKESLRNRTEEIELTVVPEIVIDGEKMTEEVGGQLLTTLCRSFDPIKPRVCFQIDSETSQQQLQLTVYLTADENSQKFVQTQMKPLLAGGRRARDAELALRDVIQWQFVPWGPTKYNETDGELVCTNGANECLANRIIACASRQAANGKQGQRADQQRLVNFVVCFFDSTSWTENPLDAANQCSSKLSPLDSYTQLWQCAVQESKLQFLLNMKDLTENNYPPMEQFPEVAVNSQRVADLSDLTLILCSHYEALPRPVECPLVPDTTAIVPEDTTTSEPDEETTTVQVSTVITTTVTGSVTTPQPTGGEIITTPTIPTETTPWPTTTTEIPCDTQPDTPTPTAPTPTPTQTPTQTPTATPTLVPDSSTPEPTTPDPGTGDAQTSALSTCLALLLLTHVLYAALFS